MGTSVAALPQVSRRAGKGQFLHTGLVNLLALQGICQQTKFHVWLTYGSCCVGVEACMRGACLVVRVGEFAAKRIDYVHTSGNFPNVLDLEVSGLQGGILATFHHS